MLRSRLNLRRRRIFLRRSRLEPPPEEDFLAPEEVEPAPEEVFLASVHEFFGISEDTEICFKIFRVFSRSFRVFRVKN